jgi:hypothetical protein
MIIITKKRYVYPVTTGACHQLQDKPTGDRNNCSVRAYANCTGIPYEEAHELFELEGRERFKGVSAELLMKIYLKSGAKYTAIGNTTGSKASVYWHHKLTGKYCDTAQGMTLSTLMKNTKYQQGNYAVWVRSHICSLIDGDLLDTGALTAGLYVCGIFDFSNEYQ